MEHEEVEMGAGGAHQRPGGAGKHVRGGESVVGEGKGRRGGGEEETGRKHVHGGNGLEICGWVPLLPRHTRAFHTNN
jgi:hypothetical protein